IGVPAKLYEYLGAGRPILATGEPDGDLAAILAESGVAYRIVPPQDPEKIRAAMTELASGSVGGRFGSVSTEQRLRFSRATLAGKLARMLEEITAGRRARAGSR